MRPFVVLLVSLVVLSALAVGRPGADGSAQPRRIIDMHLHALPVDAFPEHWDEWARRPRPGSDGGVVRGTLEALERFDVERAVTSGAPELVAEYVAASPDRVVPSLMIPASMTRERLRTLADSLPSWHRAGRFGVIGEVATQYAGMSPADPALEPIFAFAERAGVPVGIHMGLGPPAVAYDFAPRYRIEHGDPLALEEVLHRHPELDVYVMHAGYPLLDSMLALLHMHPRVYAELSYINWVIPRAEFHRYLRTLVEAGFGDRLLFGSDQMLWPDAYGEAVESIQSANFLTEDQKDAIFYRNAARLLDGAE